VLAFSGTIIEEFATLNDFGIKYYVCIKGWTSALLWKKAALANAVVVLIMWREING